MKLIVLKRMQQSVCEEGRQGYTDQKAVRCSSIHTLPLSYTLALIKGTKKKNAWFFLNRTNERGVTNTADDKLLAF